MSAGSAWAGAYLLFITGGTTCSRSRGRQEVEQHQTSPIWFDWLANTVHYEAKRDSSS